MQVKASKEAEVLACASPITIMRPPRLLEYAMWHVRKEREGDEVKDREVARGV